MNNKKLLLLTILLACLSAIFFSCSSDDDDKNLDNYFSIENANYRGGSLPKGTESLISDVKVNKNVINGGSTFVTFTSTTPLSKAYVGIKGEKGYYECALTSEKSTGTSYAYQVVLVLSQKLNADNFAITLSALAADGTLSTDVASDNISVVEVGTGLLQVSLSWDQLDDVDLHLVEPDGNRVYFGEPVSWKSKQYSSSYYALYLVKKYTSYDVSSLDIENSSADRTTIASYVADVYRDNDIDDEAESLKYLQEDPFGKVYGFLDLDSNPACGIDSVNNENITYTNRLKKGTYKVYVNLFAKCDYEKIGATYSVTVHYKGQLLTIADSQIGKFEDDYRGSTGTRNAVEIGSFTINDGDDVTSGKSAVALDEPIKVKGERMNLIKGLSQE